MENNKPNNSYMIGLYIKEFRGMSNFVINFGRSEILKFTNDTGLSIENVDFPIVEYLNSSDSQTIVSASMIIGKNGTGKSTLLFNLAQLLSGNINRGFIPSDFQFSLIMSNADSYLVYSNIKDWAVNVSHQSDKSIVYTDGAQTYCEVITYHHGLSYSELAREGALGTEMMKYDDFAHFYNISDLALMAKSINTETTNDNFTASNNNVFQQMRINSAASMERSAIFISDNFEFFKDFFYDNSSDRVSHSDGNGSHIFGFNGYIVKGNFEQLIDVAKRLKPSKPSSIDPVEISDDIVSEFNRRLNRICARVLGTDLINKVSASIIASIILHSVFNASLRVGNKRKLAVLIMVNELDISSTLNEIETASYILNQFEDHLESDQVSSIKKLIDVFQPNSTAVKENFAELNNDNFKTILSLSKHLTRFPPLSVNFARRSKDGSVTRYYLSDGERNLIDLTSRIYITSRIINGQKPNRPITILLDEVESSMHISLQMNLLRLLLDKMVKSWFSSDCYFIFATHSPIISSALPNICLNILGQAPVDDSYRISFFGGNLYTVIEEAYLKSSGAPIFPFILDRLNKLKNDSNSQTKILNAIEDPVLRNETRFFISPENTVK